MKKNDKYYCPSCGEEVLVNRYRYWNQRPTDTNELVEEVIVTCNKCQINARGFNDKVLWLFDKISSKAEVESPTYDYKTNVGQMDMASYEKGRLAVNDEDYKQLNFNYGD